MTYDRDQAPLSPADRAQLVRRQARAGLLTTSTSGLAPTIQANLLVLPARYAADFYLLCQRNPVPCPLLYATEPGQYTCDLAKGSDIRTDIPGYNVYIDGVLDTPEPKEDIMDEWSEEHVGFLLGCSYSFETALVKAGFTPHHMKQNKAVPMYTTNIPLIPAGVFTRGHYVVSMRWYKPEDVETVREITRHPRFVEQHGEPIAWGWEGAAKIGVLEKMRRHEVDFGDWVAGDDGDVPVFWGCGVTPQQAVLENAIEGVVMSHKPG
jgi:uncharacterized protein YcsI (UPF0317 family)